MATFNIGYVSSIAVFAKKFSRAERDAALQRIDTIAEEGGRCVREEIAERFASLCDFALKRVVREARSPLKTVRIEFGYGFPEHNKNWLRLGCELFVEKEELEEAMTFLEIPENAGILDSRIEAATKEFIDEHFHSAVFQELSCAVYLLETPENA